MELRTSILFLGCVLCLASLTAAISVQEDLRMTFAEKGTLDKFRSRVAPLLTKPSMKTDLYLVRWLRARDFDMAAAEKMLRENLEWRKKYRMDEILKEDWSDMMKDYPATIDTYDKEGRPIGVVDVYEWDMRNVVLTGRTQRYLRYTYYLLESITSQVFERQARGMNVTQFLVLGSADGFNLVDHGCALCIPLWVQFIQAVENNYNGWMDELIVVDAPSTYSVVLEAVRPFLSPVTRKALRVFNPNKAKWMPYLDAKIAKNQRSPKYGGTRSPVKNN